MLFLSSPARQVCRFPPSRHTIDNYYFILQCNSKRLCTYQGIINLARPEGRQEQVMRDELGYKTDDDDDDDDDDNNNNIFSTMG